MWTLRTLRGMSGMNGQNKHVSSAAVQHQMTRNLFSSQVSSGLFLLGDLACAPR